MPRVSRLKLRSFVLCLAVSRFLFSHLLLYFLSALLVHQMASLRTAVHSLLFANQVLHLRLSSNFGRNQHHGSSGSSRRTRRAPCSGFNATGFLVAFFLCRERKVCSKDSKKVQSRGDRTANHGGIKHPRS